MSETVELQDHEIRHFEKIHRHGRDPQTKEVISSILTRTHEFDENGEIRYKTLCNHEETREPTKSEMEQYSGSMYSPETVCDNCGTVWDYYHQTIVSKEENI